MRSGTAGRSVRSAEFVLALLIAVAALVTIARRLGIAYPIFLVIGGLLLGLVPGLPRPHVEPDLIFLLVLPPSSTRRRSSRRCAACARTWAISPPSRSA